MEHKLTEHDAREFENKIALLKTNPDITDEDALELSILKWDLIEAGLAYNEVSDNCALCLTHPECKNCPVREDTGWDSCSETPYQEYTWNHSSENARAEADYLRGLRDRMKSDGT